MSTTEIRSTLEGADPPVGRVPRPGPEKSPRRLAGELVVAIAAIVALAVVTAAVGAVLFDRRDLQGE